MKQLIEKMHSLNWYQVSKDVTKFINTEHQTSLKLWNPEFFMSKLQKLTRYLQD